MFPSFPPSHFCVCCFLCMPEPVTDQLCNVSGSYTECRLNSAYNVTNFNLYLKFVPNPGLIGPRRIPIIITATYFDDTPFYADIDLVGHIHLSVPCMPAFRSPIPPEKFNAQEVVSVSISVSIGRCQGPHPGQSLK